MTSMPTPTPSPSPSPSRVSGIGRAAVGAGAAVLTTVVLVALLATTASAQSSTTVTPPVTLPAENPGSTAAGVVFFGVTGAIIIGALILYLRNRRQRVPTQS